MLEKHQTLISKSNQQTQINNKFIRDNMHLVDLKKNQTRVTKLTRLPENLKRSAS